MRYQDMPEDQQALDFPTWFPIKAIGITEYNIKAILLEVLHQCHTVYESDTITQTGSKNGKYTSVTVAITANSREQLDNIYESLQARPEIVMTL